MGSESGRTPSPEKRPSSQSHEFTVRRVRGPYDGSPYEGFCACGYRTGKQMLKRDAEQAALNHQHAKGSSQVSAPARVES